MKRMSIHLVFSCLLFLGLAGSLFAKDIYVSGVTKITMRTGPGVDHKIVSMLTSGSKLEILEFQKDWSMVKTKGGKSGWVLSRFLTEQVPQTMMVLQLKKENQRLETALETAQESARNLASKNHSLVGIEEKYQQLEQASADYLKLDAEYKAVVKQSQDQKTQISSLEENMNDEEKLWFLSGAGVLILGFILGLSTRRKKTSSLLS